jgi:DNA-binding MarR family transcriptional regulator
VTQHFEASFRGAGLRATQFTVLATLELAGPVMISKLAGLLGMERTTVTRTLAPLERRGWVRATADDADHRSRRVELTAAGRAVAAKALPRWQRAQKTVGPVLERFGVRMTHDWTKG